MTKEKLLVVKAYLNKYKNLKTDEEKRKLIEEINKLNISSDFYKLSYYEISSRFLTEFEIYLANEIALISCYYDYIFKVVNTYRSIQNKDEALNNDLIKKYCDINCNNYSIVEFSIAIKLLEKKDQDYFRKINSIYKKEFNVFEFRNKVDIQKINNVLSLYKNNIDIKDIIYLLEKHYHITYNMLPKTIEDYTKVYGNNDIEILNFISREVYKNFSNLNNIILDSMDKNNIEYCVDYLLEKKYNLEYIKANFYNIKSSKLLNLSNEEKEKLSQIYISFSKKIRNEMEEENKVMTREEFILEEARKVIMDYLNSDYTTIVGYCNNKNIDFNTFKKCLNILKENNDKVYKNYQTNNSIGLDTKGLNKLAKNIANKIKSGVKEDGVIRKYDMIDYYIDAPYNIKKFLLKLKDNVSDEDFDVIRSFIGKKEEFKLGTSVFNSKVIVDVKYDEKGRMIEGSGREITLEEKEKIVNFIQENEIPLNNLTYNCGIRRCINNIYPFNEKVKVKKIKK